MEYTNNMNLAKAEQKDTESTNIPLTLGCSDIAKDSVKTWDSSFEDIKVEERVEWLQSTSSETYTYEELLTFLKETNTNHDIIEETDFVNVDLLQAILKGKEVFNELDQVALSKARARANPFESIKSMFFMNRSALKMANIDAATDFMFTNIDYDLKHKDPYNPYYFADVCAGPGGFTEYILWRKRWCFKGFGFTLKGQHDFKLHESTCISPDTFHAYYGAVGDGNICNPDNIDDFKSKVLHETKGLGVHFMTADGGFSVEGNENLQEVLSRQLYVCQCLTALEIVRPGGHFVTKLFDLFTKFSVGLLYLMYLCFEQVAILKPNSSRPANSERYFIGKYLRSGPITIAVRKYLLKIVEILQHVKEENMSSTNIKEIVPYQILKNDVNFYNYISNSNNKIGEKQRIGLMKLAIFCRNPSLIETRQEDLRNQCLQFWRIPDRMRSPHRKFGVDDLLQSSVTHPEFMLEAPKEIYNFDDLIDVITAPEEWDFAPLISSYQNNYCHFYAGISQSKVYKLKKSKWVKVKNIKLNKGTLLYAELVKEKSVSKQTGQEFEQLSLHIIDALRLENTSLADIPFHERLTCIKTFCKALNFEGSQTNIRIRPKIIRSLRSIGTNNTIVFDKVKNEYSALLELLGFSSNKESFTVNSLLLLKTGEDYSFDSTYTFRVQVYTSAVPYDHNFVAVPLVKLYEYVKSCT